MQVWTAYGGFLRPWSRRQSDGPDAGYRKCAPEWHPAASKDWAFSFRSSRRRWPRRKRGGRDRDCTRHYRPRHRRERATRQRWYNAEAHRVRGEILLKRGPANPAPAEEALLTAIAVAQQQKARSFELRAALSLAKLYQSADRAADAHAVLAPALEGFSPTLEFPEIEEVQTLLAALAETDEVKNIAAARQRRLKLQTSYGQAMMMVPRALAPRKRRPPFTRARELAAGTGNAAERFDINYGLWVGSLLRGELALARQTAEIMLREAENDGRAIRSASGPPRCWAQYDALSGRFH